MKTNEVYEVDGCKDFIPVTIDGIYDDGVPVTVINGKQKHQLVVEEVYRFPKVQEPQKVVVPKFVAEWIKKYKDKGYRLSHALEKVFDDVELSLYIKQQLGDYTEVIAKAWLAYPNITVEPEKLYTVEIGGVGSSKLFKNTRKNKYRFHCGKELEGYTDKLTEQEIKKADERLWEFAKPVEEK